MPRMIDLTGRQIGLLTVEHLSEKITGTGTTRQRWWWCRCVCGNRKEIRATVLITERTKSCGCATASLRPQNRPDPVKAAHPGEYASWQAMRTRCRNPNRESKGWYIDRGITVDPRWDSFAAFLADVGPRPSPEHTLDRIDNDGNYEPGNVRWATPSEQNRNKRTNRLLTFQGRTMPLVDWAEELGMTRAALEGRLDRRGWSVERALTTPPDGGGKTYEFQGDRLTLGQIAARTGVPVHVLRGRVVRCGWDVGRAVAEPIKHKRPKAV